VSSELNGKITTLTTSVVEDQWCFLQIQYSTPVHFFYF
jgi:hypothetical protein